MTVPNPLTALLTTPLEALARESASSPFDAVVVGGGSAGITAARALVEQGRRVAILEAGQLLLLSNISATGLRFDANLARKVQSAVSYSPLMPDGKAFGSLMGCVGGRGMFWNGASPRFSDADLRGWPLTTESLAPFYAWVEREFAVTTDYSSPRLLGEVLRRLEGAGWPAEVSPYAVDTKATTGGWLGGAVGNSFHPLLRAGALTDANQRLRLATSAFATSILFDSASGRARGVAVRNLETGAQVEVLARSVVLAAGGFESVALALRSKVPDPAGLIGRAVTDHLFVRAYYPVPQLYLPTVPEATTAIVRATASRPWQIEVHLPGDNLLRLKDPSAWKPDDTTAYAAMVRSFGAIESRMDNFVEALPRPEPGQFVVHMALSEADLARRDSMVAGLESVRQALGGSAADVQLMPLGASHHEAGGMRMGTDPAQSVTDPFGRVHTVPNVVVVDASAFSSPAATNPHITIAAIARRQALQLHADL